MGLPLPPDTTFDLYRSPNAPPAAPDAAAVPCRLQAQYDRGLQQGEGDPVILRFNYVLLCDVAVDVRDGYSVGNILATPDNLYVPDRNGVLYNVIFVERAGRGTAWNHKRVYLVRSTVPWPNSTGV